MSTPTQHAGERGAAIGGDASGATIVTGDGNLIMLQAGTPHTGPVELAAAQARLAALPLDVVPDVAPLPAGSWMPMGANPHFVGRTAELHALAHALRPPQSRAAIVTSSIVTSSVVTPSVAATGLGGIGKTQLASAFVHRYGQYFLGGVFWLSFADAASVETEVARCAEWMGDLPPGVTRMSVPEQAQLVRRAWQSPLPRLLVFDNCEDPALLTQWRPTSGGCRVLVTSRRGRWPAGQHVVPVAVGTLERGQSVALLRGLMTPSPALPLKGEGDQSMMANPPSTGSGSGTLSPVPALVEGSLAGVLNGIAGELGDLPLALHMAGSYLAEMRHDLTPAAYLAQLRRPELLQHESLQGGLLGGEYSPTDHELHVARTFALSMNQLAGDDAYEESDPAPQVDQTARRLLAGAAWLAPGEPMPRALLRAAVGLADDEGASLAARALTRLVNLGLLDEEASGSLRLHRLLQRFVVDGLGELVGEMQAAVEESVLDAARRLNKAGDPRPLLSWQIHLRHVTDNIFEQLEERAASLCNETGYHLQGTGDYAGARPYYERALAIRQAVLGEQHPDTAQSLNNLGGLLGTTGEYAGARPYYERALAIRQAVLGEQHPDTALSLNNLGGLFYYVDDKPQALAYLERALAIYEQKLGAAHPNTQTIRQSVEVVRAELGDAGALVG